MLRLSLSASHSQGPAAYRPGGMDAFSGLGSITETIKASPGKFALALGVVAILAYTVTHPSTRRARRR